MSTEPENHLRKLNQLRLALGLVLAAVFAGGFYVVREARFRQEAEAAAKKVPARRPNPLRQSAEQHAREAAYARYSNRPTAAKAETVLPAVLPPTAPPEASVPKERAVVPQGSAPAVVSAPSVAARGIPRYPGVIHGRVVLTGTPPPEKPLTALANDPNCGKQHQEIPATRFYVVGENQGLGDVVVRLKGDNLRALPPGEPKVLDQIGCNYVPYVLTLQTGQKLVVKNSDPVMHNVHTTPVVEGNREVNKAQMAKGKDLEFVFDQPEAFLRLKCDVHPWMFSYVFVEGHSYTAVTDTNGLFTITNVPPGRYTLEAIHRKAGNVEVAAKVQAGETAVVEMTLAAKE